MSTCCTALLPTKEFLKNTAFRASSTTKAWFKCRFERRPFLDNDCSLHIWAYKKKLLYDWGNVQTRHSC